MSELLDILELHARAVKTAGQIALATVIKTVGPSYRSAGARSLVLDNGTFRGGLSAGCLESDIACRLGGSTNPFIVTYDLTEADEFRGFPFGCGGTVEIFVEPLPNAQALNAVQWLANLTEPAVLLTIVSARPDSDCVSSRFGVTKSGRVFQEGFFQQKPIKSALDIDMIAETLFQEKKSRILSLPASDYSMTVFAEYFEPAISLAIFGDGEDARNLGNLAQTLGMTVRLISRNEIRSSTDIVSEYPGLCRCAVAIMTHDLNLDAALLKQLIPIDLPYLGVMGPRTRTEKILVGINADADKVMNRAQFFAPIGLNMAAETPAEIALSVISEIQLATRKLPPAHLRDTKGAIHQRWSPELIATAPGQSYVVGAILAAGASSRFGSPKQLAKLGAKALIDYSVEALQLAQIPERSERSEISKVLERPEIFEICVVLGSHSVAIQDHLDKRFDQARLRLSTIYNEKWRDGLSSSIRAAAEFAQQKKASHLLLTTSDQPFVDAALINKMLDESRASNGQFIVACKYAGRAGIPAIFPAALFSELLQLDGDKGAKSLIEKFPAKLIDFPDGVKDVDRPEDLMALSAS